MLPTERIAYSPIAEREPLKLPGGARMVVWCIVNVEEWDILSPMPRTVLTPPAGGAPSPDIPNWAWHEYGNRVGFWRMLKVFDEFKMPAALAINGSAIAAYPQIVAAANDAQLGVHRPRLHPAQHAEGGGRARRHPPHARGDHARRPASRRAAGSGPASPRPGRRRTCWSRKATIMSATGCSTTSRCG